MNLGQTTTCETLKGRETDRTQLFEHKPKESSNGEPLGAGCRLYILLYMRAAQGYP